MKNAFIPISIILAVAILAGCSRIDDDPDASSAASSTVSSEVTSGETSQPSDEIPPKEFIITKQSFVRKYEAEKGSFNGTAKDKDGNELQNTDDDGYVSLKIGQHLSQVATVTSSQFYRVVISARSNEGAHIRLQVGDPVEGGYVIPKNGGTESGGDEFQLYEIDNLYMSVGMNTINLTVENGSADIDCVVIENSEPVGREMYRTGNACVAQTASVRTAMLMRTLADNYGNVSFTAQNVSCGTNAEINAVYEETQRYPAIRGSELALALKDDEHSAQVVKNDLALAKEWDQKGGICAYTWHWYSPNAIRGTAVKDFDLAPALENKEAEELGMLDNDGIQLQLDAELLTQDAAEILYDLDKLAVSLKTLDDANVPVLFSPIPDGDTGLFWWGSDAESYKTLWQLAFVRLCKYNGLKNLIFVWNNSDFDFYPGDAYVDIIGQSFYEKSNSSFAGRFKALASDSATGRKMLAITACDTLTSIDFMNRDNAMWLWVAPDSGEYTIDRSGKLSEKYTKKSTLKNAYNNEKCITLDELAELGWSKDS